jgi:uncharacterized repeat protein (TIGR02543 family)
MATVTFEDEDGTFITTQVVVNGQYLTTFPPNPTKTGYEFDGWRIKSNGARYFSTAVVTASFTLKASWVRHDFFYNEVALNKNCELATIWGADSTQYIAEQAFANNAYAVRWQGTPEFFARYSSLHSSYMEQYPTGSSFRGSGINRLFAKKGTRLRRAHLLYQSTASGHFYVGRTTTAIKIFNSLGAEHASIDVRQFGLLEAPSYLLVMIAGGGGGGGGGGGILGGTGAGGGARGWGIMRLPAIDVDGTEGRNYFIGSGGGGGRGRNWLDAERDGSAGTASFAYYDQNTLNRIIAYGGTGGKASVATYSRAGGTFVKEGTAPGQGSSGGTGGHNATASSATPLFHFSSEWSVSSPATPLGGSSGSSRKGGSSFGSTGSGWGDAGQLGSGGNGGDTFSRGGAGGSGYIQLWY